MVTNFEGVFKEPILQTKFFEEDYESYLNLVNTAISDIRETPLEKVVVSRMICSELRKSPLTLFTSILESYPNAICYLWLHPKIGTRCGATPESYLM